MDEIMIKYIRKKKDKGLEMLIENYGGLITSIVRANLHNLDRYHEECIDDILLSVWNNIDSFDEKRNNFKNWLGAISKYKAIDYKRKYIREISVESLENLDIESSSRVEDNLLENEFKNEVEELLDILKPKEKEIFIKVYFEDKNVEEICNELEVSDTQVYNRLSRGKKKLRQMFNILGR